MFVVDTNVLVYAASAEFIRATRIFIDFPSWMSGIHSRLSTNVLVPSFPDAFRDDRDDDNAR